MLLILWLSELTFVLRQDSLLRRLSINICALHLADGKTDLLA